MNTCALSNKQFVGLLKGLKLLYWGILSLVTLKLKKLLFLPHWPPRRAVALNKKFNSRIGRSDDETKNIRNIKRSRLSESFTKTCVSDLHRCDVTAMADDSKPGSDFRSFHSKKIRRRCGNVVCRRRRFIRRRRRRRRRQGHSG